MIAPPKLTDLEEARPLLDRAPEPLPPYLLDEKLTQSLAEEFPTESIPPRPLPSWCFAQKSKSGNRLPQAIAHRGFNKRYPENTMAAFRGALEVGADALETDTHLTKDGVVVLSHDPTLKRCFGVDSKIADLTYSDIRRHRTLKAPHEHMPRLSDLLTHLAKPQNAHTWLLLDIKVTSNPGLLLSRIASTIASVPCAPDRPWNKRIVIGIWAAKYLSLCSTYLRAFPMTHIGFSIPYARQFLEVPNVSFNMLQRTLITPTIGPNFIRECKEKKRALFTWTVDNTEMMKWCIGRGLDGVITDDVELFLNVRKGWERGERNVTITPSEWAVITWHGLLLVVFNMVIWWRLGKMAKEDLQVEEKAPRKRALMAPEKSR